MDSKEFDATDLFYRSTISEQTVVFRPGIFSEVHQYLLCFVHVKEEVVGAALLCQRPRLSLVCCLILIFDDSRHCRVVGILHYLVGNAVMCEQAEQQRTQKTAQLGPCVHGDGAGCPFSHLDCLLLPYHLDIQSP